MNTELLRAQAQEFEKAAKKLRETADLVDAIGGKNGNDKIFPAEIRQPQNGTRAQELVGLIRKNGPMKRGDIIAAGIPRGTVSFLLRQVVFARMDDGKWGLAEDQTREEG